MLLVTFVAVVAVVEVAALVAVAAAICTRTLGIRATKKKTDGDCFKDTTHATTPKKLQDTSAGPVHSKLFSFPHYPPAARNPWYLSTCTGTQQLSPVNIKVTVVAP